MLPRGLLSYSICPQMSASAYEWCVQQWQNCPMDQKSLEVIGNHKLWPTLEYCLKRNQIWDKIPEVLQAKFLQQKQFFAARQLCLAMQLEELESAFNAAGIKAVLLKGSALLFYRLYPSLGERVTADIDLLIRPDQIRESVAIFQELGYRFLADCDIEYYFSQRHLPQMIRPNSLPIEIHPDVSFFLLQTNLGENIWQTATAAEEFESLMIPSATELFWHMVWHAWFNVVQLRNVLDLNLLRQDFDIDLDQLKRRAEDNRIASQWQRLINQLDEFKNGNLSLDSIHFWEWEPKITPVIPALFMKNKPRDDLRGLFTTPPRIGNNLGVYISGAEKHYFVNWPKVVRPFLAIIFVLYQYVFVATEWFFNISWMHLSHKIQSLYSRVKIEQGYR